MINALLKARASDAAIVKIADRLEPRVRQQFLDAIDLLRGRIDEAALADALLDGDVARAEQLIALDGVADDLQPVVQTLRQIFHSAGAVAADELGAVLSESLSFNLTNPRAVTWAASNGSRLITQTTEATRDGIQALIADGIASGQPAAKTAKAIAQMVGLTARQATAVANYRAELIAAGQGGDILAKRVQTYADKLLMQRARIIARTETIAASSQGQLELWRQAAADGLIDPARTFRIWIATEDDRECPICADLDGTVVPFNEPFRSDVGELWASPAHPNCRCANALRFM